MRAADLMREVATGVVDEAALAAAATGTLTYTQLGEAIGITRQSARTRWPQAIPDAVRRPGPRPSRRPGRRPAPPPVPPPAPPAGGPAETLRVVTSPATPAATEAAASPVRDEPALPVHAPGPPISALDDTIALGHPGPSPAPAPIAEQVGPVLGPVTGAVGELHLAQLSSRDLLLIADGARVGWLHTGAEGWQLHDGGGRLVSTLPADSSRSPLDVAVAGPGVLKSPLGALGVTLAESAELSHGSLRDRRGRAIDTSPASLASWSLLKGRVGGRTDVVVRGRCVGWLQRCRDGREVACTLEGPVPGSAGRNRVEVVLALLAAFTAPVPLPELGPEARTPRKPRARSRRERPISPYSTAQLAAAALAENLPRNDDGSYRVHVDDGYEDTDLGRVYRHRSHWVAQTVDGRPVAHRAATRTEAVDRLLATPGPLWGDPDEVVLHDLRSIT
ncbi:hypothetical protein [Nonomuraea typhae]|uniref:Uncharacterized protein n=1 Tax=Nonomuraea typhae TaxID=2603600 RepID=A0ABW7Z8C1_9ACTN